MAAAGVVCCVGGPALVYYVQPDPDELFKRYNPELQKRSLSEREQRLKDHQEFVRRLKEYSKSNKPVWVVAAEEEKKFKEALEKERQQTREDREGQKQQILAEEKRRDS